MLFLTPTPSSRFVVVVLFFVLFACLFVFVVILVFLGFVASDVLTIICHLAKVNVCVIIILSIGNTNK